MVPSPAPNKQRIDKDPPHDHPSLARHPPPPGARVAVLWQARVAAHPHTLVSTALVLGTHLPSVWGERRTMAYKRMTLDEITVGDEYCLTHHVTQFANGKFAVTVRVEGRLWIGDKPYRFDQIVRVPLHPDTAE